MQYLVECFNRLDAVRISVVDSAALALQEWKGDESEAAGARSAIAAATSVLREATLCIVQFSATVVTEPSTFPRAGYVVA
jgi:hypothetical protein